MPLKLYPPDQKHRTWRVRGKYLGIKVDRSSGVSEKSVAKKVLRRWQDEIERGAYAPAVAPEQAKRPAPIGFAAAALSYMQCGGDATFLLPLIETFADKPLLEFTQGDIDSAAQTLYPDATGATRNRQVYTPVSAVLHHAGVPHVRTPDGGGMKIKRPVGAQGTARTCWLKVEDAEKFFAAGYARAERIALEVEGRVERALPHVRAIVRRNATRDARTARRFVSLCLFLLYTGCRLSEALRMKPTDVELGRSFAWCGRTKNGDPRAVHLPPQLVADLANTEFGETRVFGIAAKCGRLYTWLDEVATAAGVTIPERVAFHLFRHTYAAWMRRYGAVDTSGLVATGAWRSRTAAAVYEHVETTEEAQKADQLPRLGTGGADLGEAWEKAPKMGKAQ